MKTITNLEPIMAASEKIPIYEREAIGKPVAINVAKISEGCFNCKHAQTMNINTRLVSFSIYGINRTTDLYNAHIFSGVASPRDTATTRDAARYGDHYLYNLWTAIEPNSMFVNMGPLLAKYDDDTDFFRPYLRLAYSRNQDTGYRHVNSRVNLRRIIQDASARTPAGELRIEWWASDFYGVYVQPARQAGLLNWEAWELPVIYANLKLTHEAFGSERHIVNFILNRWPQFKTQNLVLKPMGGGMRRKKMNVRPEQGLLRARTQFATTRIPPIDPQWLITPINAEEGNEL